MNRHSLRLLTGAAVLAAAIGLGHGIASAQSADAAPSTNYSQSFEKFVVGDFALSPKTYNAFSAGNTSGGSYAVRGAAEFHLGNLPLMLASDYRRYQYAHPAGVVTGINGAGISFVPGFTANDYDLNVRAGVKLLDPRVYASVAYTNRTTNYGYPQVNGFGLGVEKLADLDAPVSVHFGVFYYPNVSGNYNFGTPATAGILSYRETSYSIGATITPGKGPFFLDIGFAGDKLRAKSAPIGVINFGPTIGVGVYTR